MKNVFLIILCIAMIILFVVFFFPRLYVADVANSPLSSPGTCSGFAYFGYESHSFGINGFEIMLVNGKGDIIIKDIQINNIKPTRFEASAAPVPAFSKFKINADFPAIFLDRTSSYKLELFYDKINGTSGNQENAICA